MTDPIEEAEARDVLTDDLLDEIIAHPATVMLVDEDVIAEIARRAMHFPAMEDKAARAELSEAKAWAQLRAEKADLRTALAAAESKLAAVTAERDEAVKQQRHAWERAAEKDRAYGDMIDQRDAAESALARALEAMPTVNESGSVRLALSCVDPTSGQAGMLLVTERIQNIRDWLARLDAFRASQQQTGGDSDG